MRVNRALEKLRKFFTKRGISSTTVILAGAISAHSVQAAPVTLAKAVTAVAIVKGSIAGASTLTLVKGTMKTMTWLKIKLAIIAGIAALLVGSTTTIALSDNSSSSTSSQIQTITNAQQVLITAFFSRRRRQKLMRLSATFRNPTPQSIKTPRRFKSCLNNIQMSNILGHQELFVILEIKRLYQ